MEEQSHYVKRVQLPSGKTIEVVYFKDADGLPEDVSSFGPAVEPDQELHVCPDCDSELVYPTAWEEAGADAWRVSCAAPSARPTARASSPRTRSTPSTSGWTWAPRPSRPTCAA